MRVAYVQQSPGTSPDQAIGHRNADSLNRVNSRSRAAEGLTNKEIPQRLIVTENTVTTHVTSLFNKLGADSRARAVAVAANDGLLDGVTGQAAASA